MHFCCRAPYGARGLKWRGAYDHYGSAGAAGVRITVGERPARHPVPQSAGQGSGQPQLVSRLESGKLVIVPEEAEVVRRIYREYLEGASFVKIRRGLEADGILNGAKHARWHETNIKQILTNEKYIGDVLLQKTYTVSILDKKRSVNDGAMPKYYVEG